MKLTNKEIENLMQVAKETRENAFAHRSQHKVGASVLTWTGEIFGGCNIESVISGLGTCAERCAVDNTVSHGQYSIKAVCTLDEGFTPSCGACLQYILLFSQVSDQEIIMVNADVEGNYELDELSHLLPEGYRTKHNLEVIQSYAKNGATLIKKKAAGKINLKKKKTPQKRS